MMAVFDLLLIAALIGLAAAAIFSRNLLRAVMLFMVFGLLMALAWARLNAPDIALTEAALGAGLTGALLLHALTIFKVDAFAAKSESLPAPARSGFPGLLAVITMTGLAVALVVAVTSVSSEAVGLAAQVEASMSASGVDHPLTAVLLNFRGYDTLLEIGVLMLAVIAVWSMDRSRARPLRITSPRHNNAVLRVGLSTLIPVMIVAAGYMVWAGSFRPGGAFQSGALLAAGAVTMIASGMINTPVSRRKRARFVLAAGFIFFMGVAAVTVFFKGMLLNYPLAVAGVLILAIESLLALSIGAALAVLFAGVAGLSRETGEPSS